MKLKYYTEDDFFSYKEFFNKNGKPIEIIYKGDLKDHLLVAIPSVRTIAATRSYEGMEIYSLRKDLEEGEFYYDDLIGFPVYDDEAHLIGHIKKVQDFGASPFLVIQTEDEKTVNAFFHKEAIVEMTDDKIVIRKNFIVN